MCVVSNTIDSVYKQYPPLNTWTYPQLVDMSEVIKRLDALDKKLGAMDCYDPKKQKFLQELKDRIEELEQQVKDLKELVD